MATVTATQYGLAASQTRPGALRRAFDRVIAAREAQAKRTIAAHLLHLDDETLAARGFSRAKLARFRTPWL